MTTTTEVTMNVFFQELKKRVSPSNAKLLLHSAAVNSGVAFTMETKLNTEETKTLCLELIKTGGPCFQVGRTIYTQHVQ
ncbi:MAG: hypothetical protein AABZ31_01280 [Bdellovibrionota bacterium]